jgi:hypothetical protein
MNKKSILLGSVVVLGLFVALALITPAFARSGFGRMMGNYNGQNWGSNGCPMFDGDERGSVNNNGNNGWGMMNGNGNYGGMMGNWR